jgi:hypothetical protein
LFYSRRDGKVSFSEPATSLIGLAFLILLAILYHYMSKKAGAKPAFA